MAGSKQNRAAHSSKSVLRLGIFPVALLSWMTQAPVHAQAAGQTIKDSAKPGLDERDTTAAKLAKETKQKKRAAGNASVLSEGRTSEAAGNAETITVTGSRLIKDSIDQTQPTTVMGSEQIAKRGYTNIGMALMAENPAMAVGANSPVGSQGGNTSLSAGETYIDLFGLGSQRTLTLVNGNRFVSNASASVSGKISGSPVDFTEIPASLVDHTETVATGGAPTYGSDAIAGTENVILKNNFQGLQLDGQSGWSQHLDALNYKMSLIAGRHFNHDKGAVVFDVEDAMQYGLSASKRYYASAASPSWGEYLMPDGSIQYRLYKNSRWPLVTAAGMPATCACESFNGGNVAGVTNAAGQTLTFSPNGKSLVPLTYDYLDASGKNSFGGNGFNVTDTGNLLAQTQRVSLVTLGHYDITPHLRFNLEGWYERYDSTNMSSQPYYDFAGFNGVGAANGPLQTSTSNPYLTPAERSAIVSALQAAGESTDSFYLNRASSDWYQGKYRSENEVWRLVGGFNGDFNIGNRNFKWKISANYGSSQTATHQPEVVEQQLDNAVNTTTDTSGKIICAPGYANAPLEHFRNLSCSPLNPFGVGNASAAALNYIQTPSKVQNDNSQLDIVADVKGKLASLPAGDIQLDIGYEHRREMFNFIPDAFWEGELMSDGSRGEYGIPAPLPPTKGGYDTNEAFGEVDIPLVSPRMDIPGIYHLSANSAGRYVHNSATGGFWSYTAGAAWSPTRDLTFRGNYTRSLRAPGVAELYAPTSTTFEAAADPCDVAYINGGANPVRRAANCAAAGVPRGFHSNISEYEVPGMTGGNPHLKNETATSFSAGGVIKPRFAKGLSLQADYVDIKVQNEIATIGTGGIMNACYDSSGFPNNEYCKLFTRGPDSQVTNFLDAPVNIGREEMRGLQSTLRYELPLERVGLPSDFGEFDTSVNYMHYFYHRSFVAGSVSDDIGGSGSPKDNFTANINYSRGPLFYQWQIMYYGPSRVDPNQPKSLYQYPKFDQYFMFNMSIGYQFANKYTVQFMMDNVFDAKPQFPYAGSETRYFEGIMGRTFRFSIAAVVF